MLNIDGNILRVISTTQSDNFTLTIDAVEDNPDLYGSTSGYSAYGRVERLYPISSTKIEVLDLPALPNDFSQYMGHVYVGVVGLAENWSGANIFVSFEESGGYEKILSFDKPSTIGGVIKPLSNDSNQDEQFIVNIIDGELINGNSLAVVGDEVIEFTTARLIGKYQYQISGIKRGRYGSMKHHVAGERFILIDQDLQTYKISNEHIGKTIYIKAVTNGSTLGDTEAYKFVYQANTLKPYAPAELKVTANEELGIKFKWRRRSRIYTNAEVPPLGEEKEEYYYELIPSESCSIDNEVASLSGKTNTCSITLPFIKEGSFRVAQISAIVGNGEFAAIKVGSL